MDSISIIGTHEIPLLRAGWLVPVLREGKKCFSFGSYSIKMEEAEFGLAIQKNIVIGFEEALPFPLNGNTAKEYNQLENEIKDTPLAVFYMEESLAKQISFDVETFSKKYPRTSMVMECQNCSGYIVAVLWENAIEEILQIVFKKYRSSLLWEVNKPMKDGKGKELWEDCASLLNFVYNEESVKQGIAIYLYVMKKFELVSEENRYQWANAQATEWGIEMSPHEWDTVVNEEISRYNNLNFGMDIIKLSRNIFDFISGEDTSSWGMNQQIITQWKSLVLHFLRHVNVDRLHDSTYPRTNIVEFGTNRIVETRIRDILSKSQCELRINKGSINSQSSNIDCIGVDPPKNSLGEADVCFSVSIPQMPHLKIDALEGSTNLLFSNKDTNNVSKTLFYCV